MYAVAVVMADDVMVMLWIVLVFVTRAVLVTNSLRGINWVLSFLCFSIIRFLRVKADFKD